MLEDYPTRRTSFVQVISRLINDPYIQIILTPIEQQLAAVYRHPFLLSFFFFFYSTSVTDGRIHWPHRVLLVESVTCTNDKKKKLRLHRKSVQLFFTLSSINRKKKSSMIYGTIQPIFASIKFDPIPCVIYSIIKLHVIKTSRTSDSFFGIAFINKDRN